MKTENPSRIEEKQKDKSRKKDTANLKPAIPGWLQVFLIISNICIEHLFTVHNVRNWKSGFMRILSDFATAF